MSLKKPFISNFVGICRDCQRPYLPGDRLVYSVGSAATVHVDCVEAGKAWAGGPINCGWRVWVGPANQKIAAYEWTPGRFTAWDFCGGPTVGGLSFEDIHGGNVRIVEAEERMGPASWVSICKECGGPISLGEFNYWKQSGDSRHVRQCRADEWAAVLVKVRGCPGAVLLSREGPGGEGIYILKKPSKWQGRIRYKFERVDYKQAEVLRGDRVSCDWLREHVPVKESSMLDRTGPVPCNSCGGPMRKDKGMVNSVLVPIWVCVCGAWHE